MKTSLKPNMLQSVNRYIELLDANELHYDTKANGAIPEDICNVRQLKELLELIGEDEIHQHIQDAEDKETAETKLDLHYHC